MKSDRCIPVTRRPLVPVSSLSIFALLLSFLILLVFGFVNYGMTFNVSMLKPLSLIDLCASMGAASFSLGYNFSFLSFYVPSRFLFDLETSEALAEVQSQARAHAHPGGHYRLSTHSAASGVLFLLELSEYACRSFCFTPRRHLVRHFALHSLHEPCCDCRVPHDVCELSVHLPHLRSSAQRDFGGNNSEQENRGNVRRRFQTTHLPAFADGDDLDDRLVLPVLRRHYFLRYP